MKRVEHIGIAVSDLEAAEALYTRLLQVAPYKHEEVAGEQVNTAFFRVDDTKIELLQSTDPEGVIARFIAKRGAGIHHIAFEVKDIVSEMERLRNEGFHLLSEAPKIGADNKLVCFVHPKDTQGVLIELCQERDSLI
ncbi:methylmalonyl-CoA/ethylmalonyl-CoA epimerase [Dyadobacter jejuensis]|uniref:Methylmalonyl-CoA/ethylmalonyl-CoA epimerase n=2 Tax=Dyadobacter jejuensis TaxID=1082580 RepID=A0A316AQ19_9BACT|nr:methylmalonyl-CoA/ethylmalonyl-CoA epimerase [Dyadobacter jejuensis]